MIVLRLITKPAQLPVAVLSVPRVMVARVVYTRAAERPIIHFTAPDPDLGVITQPYTNTFAFADRHSAALAWEQLEAQLTASGDNTAFVAMHDAGDASADVVYQNVRTLGDVTIRANHYASREAWFDDLTRQTERLRRANPLRVQLGLPPLKLYRGEPGETGDVL